MVGLEDGAQKHRLAGGAQLVASRMAEGLGDAVRLAWPVRRIRHDDTGAAVAGEAGTVSARVASVAIPPTLAGRLDYDPPLPAQRDLLTQRLPGGSVIHAPTPMRDWAAEPWTRGCYAAHLPPGAWTRLGPALRRPLGRLH